jgi:esterase/lipase superfamily enzyme
MKTAARWRSERLEREVTLRPLIDAGRIKLYSCDSVAGRALLAREGSARRQMWLQNQFHQYVRHEVAPAIRTDCQDPGIEVWAAGASIGAFHAVAMVCRFPDVFARACAMSGTYDLRRFHDAGRDGFSDEFWVSSPLHFVPTLSGRHLDVLRRRFILMPSGEGRAEAIGESWAMARVLGERGIPNRVDSWGPEWHHDWVTWRKMLPQVFEEWTR